MVYESLQKLSLSWVKEGHTDCQGELIPWFLSPNKIWFSPESQFMASAPKYKQLYILLTTIINWISQVLSSSWLPSDHGKWTSLVYLKLWKYLDKEKKNMAEGISNKIIKIK